MNRLAGVSRAVADACITCRRNCTWLFHSFQHGLSWPKCSFRSDHFIIIPSEINLKPGQAFVSYSFTIKVLAAIFIIQFHFRLVCLYNLTNISSIVWKLLSKIRKSETLCHFDWTNLLQNNCERKAKSIKPANSKQFETISSLPMSQRKVTAVNFQNHYMGSSSTSLPSHVVITRENQHQEPDREEGDEVSFRGIFRFLVS